MFILPYRDENATRSVPILTITIIALNVYCYFQFNLTGSLNKAVGLYGFVPNKLLIQPQTLMTSMFLHAGFLHLFSNMWFMWLFGDNIEDYFGWLRFIQLFLLAGIVGNLTHALFSFFLSSTPVIGASGAVAGVMGSYLAQYPYARIRCIFLLIFYPIFFRMHAFILLAGWMIIEFLNALLNAHSMTAHWAHVGGFAFGYIWTMRRK